ncbi:hypothetical protein ABT025_36925 [Streptomyces sp. NPDC002809]|uniref:hypothetical protein n=1 Tax=Streptomyces sp. NPDC002809 TaxID=3154433 RepID=UPI003328D177
MASVVVAACVALGACACGPEDSEDDKDTNPSQPSMATRPEQPAATPSGSARPEKPSAEPTGDQRTPRTRAGAIHRYEQYLHALGREDIDEVCEVARPAAQKAQDQGFGPCTSTYATVFQMISSTQKKALRTATVDPQRIVVRTPDKIDMPVEAVRASATFSESDLGSYTLEYLKNDWYITD